MTARFVHRTALRSSSSACDVLEARWRPPPQASRRRRSSARPVSLRDRHRPSQMACGCLTSLGRSLKTDGPIQGLSPWKEREPEPGRGRCARHPSDDEAWSPALQAAEAPRSPRARLRSDAEAKPPALPAAEAPRSPRRCRPTVHLRLRPRRRLCSSRAGRDASVHQYPSCRLLQQAEPEASSSSEATEMLIDA